MILQEWRQREFFAQVRQVFAVRRETWAIRGDLEKDVTRNTEVKRLKIETVHQTGVGDPVLSKVLFPGALLFDVGDRPGDVMHATPAPGAPRSFDASSRRVPARSAFARFK